MVSGIFRVIFSRKSRQRLKEISDYYEENASPAVARKVREGLVSTAKKLDRFPESKPKLPGTEDLDYPVRYARKWSFKIIF